jgi:probable phosphoglycerate mutase
MMLDATARSTRIVLIRHGESASNAEGWLSGQDSCGGLTPLGIAQAEALRDRLAADASLRPDRILVSTMRRAVQTAEIVAAPIGLVVEQHADLIERTSGEAEGLRVEEYIEKYGKAPWTDWTNPLSPGGESGAEFSARVTAALDRVAREAAGQSVWIVCHGGVIMSTAVGRWPGGSGDLSSIPLASPMNSSISEWVVGADGAWTMARFNDHTHLVGVSNTVAPLSI